MKKKAKTTDLVVYQTKTGAIELSTDNARETIWATQAQMAAVFSVKPQAITRHLKNIYADGELSKKATCSKMEQVQIEGKRQIKRSLETYNLDAIISVGYRINSKTATKFRQWATKTLKTHIVEGYTINKKRIGKNYDNFIKTVNEVKKILPAGGEMDAGSALELAKMFASTWLSLDAYDKSSLPRDGTTRKLIEITAQELVDALSELKSEIKAKKEASDLFGREQARGSLAGIVGNVFQSFNGADLYGTLEEKAAHLFYFIVKNHPFVDGNKRSGAFAFVWFLRKAGLLDTSRLTPEALTAFTLLIAESSPRDKERMIGLILMLLGK